MNEEVKLDDNLNVSEDDMADIDPKELAKDAAELAEKLQKNAKIAELANAKFIQSDDETVKTQKERQELKDADKAT